jgi:sporulation-control protein
MSVFKKVLTTVGIGTAKVDTHLYHDLLIPGEMLDGEVHITGTDVSQEIGDIYLYLATQYKQDVNKPTPTQECVLLKYHLTERFALPPNEEKVIPFSFQLPHETPLTLRHQPVYLCTGPDIANGIDPKDTDYILVRPHPLMQRVLDALENLGFQLSDVNCAYHPRFGSKYPFTQEFEFRPIGKYRGRLNELEVIFSLKPDELEVFLELNKRARGFGTLLEEDFNLDGRYIRFHVTPTDLNLSLRDLEAIIDGIIQSHLR